MTTQHRESTAPTAREADGARRWADSAFGAGALPFSFTCGGTPSAELLRTWSVARSDRTLDDRRRERTLTFTEPRGGLVVRCVAVTYGDFPVAEWTLYFRNDGKADTPILADILPLDAQFDGAHEGAYVLHHHTGSPCTPGDYQPFATPLGAKAERRITTSGGRSSNSDLPYFNVAWAAERAGGAPEPCGVMIAIGWPGQWAARFIRDDCDGLRIAAGQEFARFVLHPGEEVRTPLIVLHFWEGDRVRAQNLWRRWMRAHNSPHPRGVAPEPQLAACSSHQFGEMIHADEASQILFVDRYLEEGLRLDYWWMDAGWYPNETGWPNTGTWEVDTKRFPRGLRYITDHAHANGVRSIVWFEPERVTPGTWLYEQHPEWLLGRDGEWKLLNLGNPGALHWLTEHVDRLIVAQGIDLYRQDFNIDPLGFWRANDPPDREGITEIRYVEGLLAFWDELRRRHPNILIDTCASGGRRNDVEVLRRAVPLLRSDYIFEPTSQQCHTHGIAPWIPFYGTGMIREDAYSIRSTMCPAVTACWDVRRSDLDYDLLRRMVAELKTIAPYQLGDYYPLTPYHLGNDVWTAWQFDRPELGGGVVQAFRRPESSYESACFFLRGLDADARYVLANGDVPGETRMSGRALMEEGLVVTLAERPGSAVIMYRRDEV